MSVKHILENYESTVLPWREPSVDKNCIPFAMLMVVLKEREWTATADFVHICVFLISVYLLSVNMSDSLCVMHVVVCFKRDRLLISLRRLWTPFESWSENGRAMAHFRPWSCPAHRRVFYLNRFLLLTDVSRVGANKFWLENALAFFDRLSKDEFLCVWAREVAIIITEREGKLGLNAIFGGDSIEAWTSIQIFCG